jgi:hypothetical protein
VRSEEAALDAMYNARIAYSFPFRNWPQRFEKNDGAFYVFF